MSVTSADAFDGTLTVSVGIDTEGTVTAIAFTELNETAGMGMNADKPEFKEQFNGRKADEFILDKGGNASAENEINSVTGASRTSGAVVNAVNTALAFYRDHIA
ncbi:MAG: FMN-binding protein [Lachnospiraceae bacterium]|nr:FMN-binding protein [Lachnospiraceae bacterium]